MDLIKKIILSILLTNSAFSSSDSVDTYLNDLGKKFNGTPKSERYEFVTQPILLKNETITNLPLNTKFDSYHDTAGNVYSPLTLAVTMGDDTLVEKFLPSVKNLRDKKFITQGFRQPYNLFHLALDPLCAESESNTYFMFHETQKDKKLKNLLHTIDLLGKKANGDTKLINDCCPVGRKSFYYQNPPLAAGQASGLYKPYSDALRARAMLYGADPAKKGSCFPGLNLSKRQTLVEFLFHYYVELKVTEVQIYPVSPVQEAIKDYAGKKGFDHDKFENLLHKRTQLKNQLATFENKHFRIKKDHLKDVCEEIRYDLKNVEKVISRITKF